MTRSDLRDALQAAGFKYREAEDLVTVILDSFIRELRVNGRMEFPFGEIRIVRRPEHRDYRFGRIIVKGGTQFVFIPKEIHG